VISDTKSSELINFSYAAKIRQKNHKTSEVFEATEVSSSVGFFYLKNKIRGLGSPPSGFGQKL